MHDEAYDVLPELIARLELRSPVLIGHSDGASISLLHASEQPVAGLVLIAPHVFVESETLHGIRAIRTTYRSGGLREHLSMFHDDPDLTFWKWTDVWMSAEFRGWNIEAELADIGCPVLLVQGKADQYGTTAQLDAIERAVTGSVRRVEIADCGHTPHLEHADELHHATTTFLRTSATTRIPCGDTS